MKVSTVLVAPLDWGLGHASRSYPLIKELQQMGHRVILGVSGQSGEWLKKEFPNLISYPLPSYSIRYSRNGPAWFSVLLQANRFLQSINEEKKWLSQFLKQEKIDIILSDNRYGLSHPDVKSILITHQLRILGLSFSFINRWMEGLLHKFIKSFNEVWIPDTEGESNLSGQLTHPSPHNVQTRYIGLLSRFYLHEKGNKYIKKYRYAFVISGPDPRRTAFEKICINLIKQTSEPCVMIRGTEKAEPLKPISHLTVINLADTQTLYEIVTQSEIIISRSGYSSIMDWVCLGIKAILVPTPGQPEQIYLAGYLQSQQLFSSISEQDLKAKGIPVLTQHDSKSFNFNAFKESLRTCLSFANS